VKRILWFIAFLSLPALLHAAPLPEPVAQALRSAGIPVDSVGLFVQETGAPRPLLAHRARQPMSPASTMKLVTTYAALELLGPAYTWETALYAAAAPQDGVLDGNLYLQGSGDPALTLERFWLLLRDLRMAGLREIRGDLVLDGSRFSTNGGDPGAFDGDAHRPYNALPEAVLLNFKSTRFRLLPATDGQSVHVLADPAPPQLRIVNQLRAVAGACGDWRDGVSATVAGNGGSRLAVTFSGPFPADCGEKSWHLALFDNTAYVDALFRQLWEESGGILSGAARRGETPPAARLLASQESRPLTDQVRDVNKFSNNLMARQLLLTLGNGSEEGGAQAVAAWLSAKKLAFPELVVENGSGLSRREQISAGNLGALLLAAWRSPVMAEFVSSLPIAAVDGTMKKRLRERAVAGHAHIKTGSLKNVRAIAGYVHDAQGRTWALVFLVNHPNAAAAQAAQDALLEWVYQRVRVSFPP
jgi:D-alanyl-D-alanine carboxypeptidase/D-alanyl-D-alanine-endopeptidase (penicillin-binding protein 4)